MNKHDLTLKKRIMYALFLAPPQYKVHATHSPPHPSTGTRLSDVLVC